MKTRKLWLGTEPNPQDRLIVEVSEIDYQRIAAAKGSDSILFFSDALTGHRYGVQYADCGADCKCALEVLISSAGGNEHGAL